MTYTMRTSKTNSCLNNVACMNTILRRLERFGFGSRGSELRLLTQVASLHALGDNWQSRCCKSYVRYRNASWYQGGENAWPKHNLLMDCCKRELDESPEIDQQQSNHHSEFYISNSVEYGVEWTTYGA